MGRARCTRSCCPLSSRAPCSRQQHPRPGPRRGRAEARARPKPRARPGPRGKAGWPGIHRGSQPARA
eukprot:2809987-Lingulodinium_polyedra.AAC.1